VSLDDEFAALTIHHQETHRALQTFKSVKAATAFAKNFKRNGRKRRPVLVAQLGASTDDVGRSGQRGELPAAGHVVVVEVRLDDVGDPGIGLARGVEVDVDVAAGIDDGSNPGPSSAITNRACSESIAMWTFTLRSL
jgi:hypothetical protein